MDLKGNSRLSRVIGAFTAVALLTGLALAAVVASGCGAPVITLATTQAVSDSGVLDDLLPAFEKQYDAKVVVDVSQTSAGVSNEGLDGKADVLLLNKKAAEDFTSQVKGTQAIPVMYNDLIVVGPEADPAGVKGFDCPGKASKKISVTQALYVSRGDGSDINKMEMGYWEKNGVGNPTGQVWYVKTGTDMESTLKAASEKQGYVLTDMATFTKTKDGLKLVPLVSGCAMLMNHVEAVAVQGDNQDAETAKLSQDLVNFMTSKEGQALIGNCKMGEMVLYHPDATKEPAEKMPGM